MTKIDDLKQKWNVKTTEELFGVGKPADFQCGFIDELLKKVRYIENDTKICNADEYDNLVDKLQDIEYYISDIESGLEELRNAIDSVRTWGQTWKDMFKEVVDQNNVDLSEWI